MILLDSRNPTICGKNRNKLNKIRVWYFKYSTICFTGLIKSPYGNSSGKPRLSKLIKLWQLPHACVGNALRQQIRISTLILRLCVSACTKTIERSRPYHHSFIHSYADDSIVAYWLLASKQRNHYLRLKYLIIKMWVAQNLHHWKKFVTKFLHICISKFGQ